MKFIIFCLVLGLASISAVGQRPADRPQIDLIFCHLPMEPDIKNSHATLDFGFRFRLDSKGKIQDFVQVRGPKIPPERIAACVSRWNFTNVGQKSPILVLMKWEHAIGWTELFVRTSGFRQKLRIEGELCPYREPEKEISGLF
jgi:hypothetical protein